MSLPSIVEKLHLTDEKNLLIQGLPSSIEKQFAKLSFAKNVTPLLKSRKIDWALVFAVNENQLNGILKEVLPALNTDGKLWVAYPKSTSKITSDLNRDCSWSALTGNGYSGVAQVALDHVWSALWWKKEDKIEKDVTFSDQMEALKATLIDPATKTVKAPDELEGMFEEHPGAKDAFENLTYVQRRNYVNWILTVESEQALCSKVVHAIEMLESGKISPNEK
jgi:hypothetical protein